MKTSLKIASRKFFLVLSLAALLIFSASALFAQQGGGMGGNATPEQRAARQTERMKDQLKLTPAQEPKMPIGMSRLGFLVSSATVETASNPM